MPPYTVYLRSGGSVTIDVSINPLALTQAQAEWLDGLCALIREYEAEHIIRHLKTDEYEPVTVRHVDDR